MTHKLSYMFFIPGLSFDGDTIKIKALGGSETAGYYMARELCALDNDVTVFSNCEEGREGIYDGVKYLNVKRYEKFARTLPNDVMVIQRTPEAFAFRNNSKVNILWQHDLALLRGIEAFKGNQWNIDQTFVVSEFMKEQYKKVYDTPDGSTWVTKNGIDLSLVEKVMKSNEGKPRNLKRLVYSARAERGLDVMLINILPALLERDKEIELVLCGYENKGDPRLEGFYEEINKLIQSFGDRVTWAGNLSKEKIYELYSLAGAYVYPTPSPISKSFKEVFCINVLEAQACGLPVVTTNNGALGETLGKGAGSLIDGVAGSDAYNYAFVGEVMKYINNANAHGAASAKGIAHSKHYDWKIIAKQWHDHINEMIIDKSSNKDRLLKHFIRQSDIMPALEILKTHKNEEIEAEINKDYYFVVNNDYVKHYEKIGKTHDARALQWTLGEPRYQYLKKYLESKKEIKNVLDYGCAHGSYAINLSNELGLRITGVDHDKFGIKMAREHIKHAKTPDNLKFYDASEYKPWPDDNIAYDAALLFEILEHVPEPWTLVDELENIVPEGCRILITVPIGPWEYSSYKTYPHRAHIWHFDQHDVFEMFGEKDGLNVQIINFGQSEEMGEFLGWHFITYNNKRSKTNKIDMKRKLEVQSPRETLSVCIVAGDAKSEETLLWNLKSIEHIADEIIIADTGMTETAKAIADRFNVKYVNAPNPTTHGFETPRNMALDKCRMDWVMWIDTDERLLDQVNVHKYLRNNCFDGYAITQHHFAYDTTFKPDIPVRLFRKIGKDGKPMRFFGMIHEHPEKSLNEGPGHILGISDVNIAHIGYLTESVRRNRFSRNLPMLAADIKKYPERILQKHMIMRDNMLLVQYELSTNGAVLTQDLANLCKETIQLFKKHFLGKQTMVGIESIEYYSQALKILGEGVDVSFNVDTSNSDARNPQQGTRNLRFASKEDFKIYMDSLISDKFDKFENEYY